MGLSTRGGVARRPQATRRRVDRSARPTLDGLERRELMAAGAIGINTTSEYVDLIKAVRDFAPAPWYVEPNGVVPPLTRDANGWPTSDSSLGILDDRTNEFWNGPDPNVVKIDLSGTYHLSFHGTAVVHPNGSDMVIRNQVYDAASNTTTVDVVVLQNGNSDYLGLAFTQTRNVASATGAGITDLKMIRPGYAADTTQLFTNDLINALKGFDTLRIGNLTGTNQFTPQKDANGRLIPLEWSQRRTPLSSSQDDHYQGKLGESWEYMVQLANETNANMWINIPDPASDDYIANLANLIKNGSTVGGVTYPGLKAGLKVYVEYSNEVWGGTPNPYDYNIAATRQELASGSTPITSDGNGDLYTLAGRRYMERTAQISRIFQGVFGPDPNHDVVRPYLGWQEDKFDYFQNTLPWFESTFGAPKDYFYGIGNANYFGSSDYSSVDALLNSLRAAIPAATASATSFTAIARSYGLKNVSYEGGPGIGTTRGTPESLVGLAASRDPRITAIIEDYYTGLFAAGVDLTNYTNGPYGIWSPEQQWAAAELANASNPTASPKFKALRDLMAAPPVVVTAGHYLSSTAPINLPLVDDTKQDANLPYTGQNNFWLLNAQQAGTYHLVMTTSRNFLSVADGTVQVLVDGRNVLGTYTVTNYATIDLGLIPLPAGVSTLSLHTVRGKLDPTQPANWAYYSYASTALTLTPVSTTMDTAPRVGDAGFEDVALGVGDYRYNAAGSAWTFINSGLAANNSAFTGNYAAPAGTQVAFLQYNSSFSQSVAGWQAGNYTISFAAAQRAWGSSQQDFRVLVDGVAVGTFKPRSASYQTLTTLSFAVSAGSHTITFQGLNSAGGENTAFIDAVTISAATTLPTTPSVGDAGFEDVALGVGDYRYNAAGSAWTFINSGLAANNSAFTGNYAAPAGTQVAFLQYNSSFSQSVAGWQAGRYTISFAAAQRAWGSSQQDFRVLVDGVAVGTFKPSSASYQTLVTASFAVTAGTHTITFQGLNSVGGENTAFIDSVAIAVATTLPTTPSVGDAGFEDVSVGVGDYRYNAAGSAWTFTNSGLAANNSAFTGNYAAPAGTQVAFLQYNSSFSQSVAGWQAGRYTISFAAAQRAWGSSQQDFRVLVDGVAVGTFKPRSASYQTLTTLSFAVSAGSHTITFQGLNSAGGENTAFIDAVTISAAS